MRITRLSKGAQPALLLRAASATPCAAWHHVCLASGSTRRQQALASLLQLLQQKVTALSLRCCVAKQLKCHCASTLPRCRTFGSQRAHSARFPHCRWAVLICGTHLQSLQGPPVTPSLFTTDMTSVFGLPAGAALLSRHTARGDIANTTPRRNQQHAGFWGRLKLHCRLLVGGVSADTPVAVLVDKCFEAYIALIANLKAGGAELLAQSVVYISLHEAVLQTAVKACDNV
jgi:hypothetical protein